MFIGEACMTTWGKTVRLTLLLKKISFCKLDTFEGSIYSLCTFQKRLNRDNVNKEQYRKPWRIVTVSNESILDKERPGVGKTCMMCK